MSFRNAKPVPYPTSDATRAYRSRPKIGRIGGPSHCETSAKRRASEPVPGLLSSLQQACWPSHPPRGNQEQAQFHADPVAPSLMQINLDTLRSGGKKQAALRQMGTSSNRLSIDVHQ